MRQNLQQKIESQEKHDIDLAPLLDVVFILLIFFIVTSVFVLETGVDIDKPTAISTKRLDRSVVLIAITPDNKVVYAGTNVGIRGVRNTIAMAMKKSVRPVIIQSDKKVSTEILVKVLDQVKLGGATNVSISTVDR